MARLTELLRAIPIERVVGDPDVDVVGITHDSRQVTPGSLYCSVRGEHLDGHDFAGQAVAAGAVAILGERELAVGVPEVVVANTREALGPLAAALFGEPSRRLEVVGVTGTNGKTTTTHLLQSILATAGRPAEVIGTLTGARTTPEAPELQALLADFTQRGTRAVAMEVSSHALAMHRVDGTWFTVGVFTNLSPDHLDFHPSMQDYFATKTSLFRSERCGAAVINVEDPWGRQLVDEITIPWEPYGVGLVDEVQIEATSSRCRWEGVELVVPLGGRFNLSNALAAAVTARRLGIDRDAIAAGLAAAGPVAGRFEPVDAGQPFNVFVDYAHTPDGLEQVLTAARSVSAGHRVHLVFGCGGDRDTAKRPLMGEVAARLADRTVLTSDNPRSEDPDAIIDAIMAGIPDIAERRAARTFVVEPDRRAAIATAIAGAAPGDVVIIAGKGHETTQTIGDVVIPFDDRVVARSLLEGVALVGMLIAAAVAMAASLVGTRLLIDVLRARHVGQPIREEGPKGHHTKAGTPTMGGMAIVLAALLGYAVAHLRSGVIFTYSGLLLMLAVAGAGVVGFIDDWVKVKNERNLGLNKRTKVLGLLTVAIGFSVLAVNLTDVHTTLSFTRYSSTSIELGTVGWVVWAVFLILGFSNAVNLTDGLDGLAAGSALYAFICYLVIGFWGFRHESLYHITHSYDLAVCAAAMLGACVGFLWWNANPARIFMGDTGSLAIGTALAGLALLTSTQLLLPIVGGLFVLEAVSVMLQVTSFQLLGGRRVFRMAPIHHHFELAGWPETTVIVRFWILAGLCAALALGFYYADFLAIGGVD